MNFKVDKVCEATGSFNPQPALRNLAAPQVWFTGLPLEARLELEVLFYLENML